MRSEVEINPPRPLDRSASIRNRSPAPAGHMHTGSKGIISRIGGNGAIMMLPQPGKHRSYRNHPGMEQTVERQQPRLGSNRAGSGGGFSVIWRSSIFSGADIPVPKVKFEKFPASPLPGTTLAAPTIGSGFYYPMLPAGTTAKQQTETKKGTEHPGCHCTFSVSRCLFQGTFF